MATIPRQPPTLMGIPTEVRDRISTYVAVENEPIVAGIASTCDTDFGLGRVSRPPSLASVNKQLRHEVLQIYYSGNKFTLGNKNCQIDHFLCSGSIREWRHRVGDYTRHLCDVKIVSGNLHYESSPFQRLSSKERGSFVSTRARFLQDGTLAFEQQHCKGQFCTCFFRRYLAEGGIQNIDKRDGRQLLTMLEDCVEKFNFYIVEFFCKTCEDCGLQRLERRRQRW